MHHANNTTHWEISDNSSVIKISRDHAHVNDRLTEENSWPLF